MWGGRALLTLCERLVREWSCAGAQDGRSLHEQGLYNSGMRRRMSGLYIQESHRPADQPTDRPIDRPADWPADPVTACVFVVPRPAALSPAQPGRAEQQVGQPLLTVLVLIPCIIAAETGAGCVTAAAEMGCSVG